MGIDADILADRRRLKRLLLIWRTLAIVIVVVLAALALGRFGGFDGLGGSDYLARLSVNGVIVDDERRHRLLERIATESFGDFGGSDAPPLLVLDLADDGDLLV